MRRTQAFALAGAALAAALGACSRHDGTEASAAPAVSSNYCTSFKAAAASGAPAAPSDPAAAFEDCVHRWGYALAPGRDTAEVVAEAVVDACTPALTAWNQQTLNQYQQGQDQPQNADAGGPPAEGGPSALSLTTGQNTDVMGERTRFAQSRALFYVVQARAGHCSPPPANTLALNAGAAG